MLGVLLCLAARRKDDPGIPQQSLVLNRASVGPLVGGLLLVTISGFGALGAVTSAIYATLLAAAVGTIAFRIALPPISVVVRRVLVSPFVMVAGGLYWTLIEQVVGTPGAPTARRNAPIDWHSAALPLFFLVAFSAIYYAMLVYAPRQIAQREGGAVEWLLRYAAFIVSIVLGIGWLRVLSS